MCDKTLHITVLPQSGRLLKTLDEPGRVGRELVSSLLSALLNVSEDRDSTTIAYSVAFQLLLMILDESGVSNSFLSRSSHHSAQLQSL